MDMLKFAQRFVNDTKTNLAVKEIFPAEKRHDSVFDAGRKEIRINPEKIFQHANKYRINMEDYLIMSLCHRIGYFLDPEHDVLNKNIAQKYRELENAGGAERELLDLILEKEINAGKYGEQFIPEHLLGRYREIERKNLILKKQWEEIEIIEYSSRIRRTKMSNEDSEYYAIE